MLQLTIWLEFFLIHLTSPGQLILFPSIITDDVMRFINQIAALPLKAKAAS